MNKETRIIDLTIEQLELLISDSVKKSFVDQAKTLQKEVQKEFYTPKEFSHITGIPYSTVVYRCKLGKLKARQDDPNCSWQIFATEVSRYSNEATENTL